MNTGTVRALLLAAFATSACAVGPGQTDPETPEAELAQRSSDLQRSVQEAALTGFLGAGGIYVFAGARGLGPGIGIIGAIPIAVTTGTYVGYLQQQYRDDEARRERLREDIARANAESDAAIQTIETVIQRQQQTVAAAVASGSPRARAEAMELVETNVANIAAAGNGLTRREAELSDGGQAFSPRGADPVVDDGLEQLRPKRREIDRLLAIAQMGSTVLQPASE